MKPHLLHDNPTELHQTFPGTQSLSRDNPSDANQFQIVS